MTEQQTPLKIYMGATACFACGKAFRSVPKWYFVDKAGIKRPACNPCTRKAKRESALAFVLYANRMPF